MIKSTSYCRVRWILWITLVSQFCYTGKAIPSTMKAIVVNTYGNPDALEVGEAPVPEYSKTQVLVRVKAAGINPVDMYMRDGSYIIKPQLPAILGKEIAGIVEEVGYACTLLQKGDRVFCYLLIGGYAEYAVADEHNCYPLYGTLTFSQGASLYVTYFCAVRGLLDKGNLESGHAILIHGASGNFGAAAIQVAKEIGATVVATVRHHGVEKLMRNAGADCVVYHDAENYLQQSLKEINRTGFDVIMEVLGRIDIERDKSVLVQHGRIIVVGNRAPIITYRESIATGQPILYTVGFFKFKQSEHDAASEFILDGIRKGSIRPLVGYEYKFEEAPKAHRDLMYKQGEIGKSVFVLD